jgi:hypothetical protein
MAVWEALKAAMKYVIGDADMSIPTHAPVVVGECPLITCVLMSLRMSRAEPWGLFHYLLLSILSFRLNILVPYVCCEQKRARSHAMTQ